MLSAEQKGALRTALRKQRADMPRARSQHNDRAICTVIARHGVFSTFRQVFFYAAINAEPDLTALAQQWCSTKLLALPVVTADKLTFYRWQPGDALQKGKFNIPEPVAREVLIPDRHTLVLLPCLALDRSGNRLGYGAGYYDRLLAMYPSVCAVGICYQLFLHEQLPVASHDRRVDYIVTEEGVQSSIA